VNAVGVVSGVILGLVFAWSGAAKLRAGDNWKVAGTAFSTSRKSVDRLVEGGLPWCEIVLGAMLVAHIAPTVFGALSGVLLLGFTAAIVRVIQRGESTPCMCFGSASTSNVSWRQVWRNAGLIALAVTTVVAA
jgi:hypothetical protein